MTPKCGKWLKWFKFTFDKLPRSVYAQITILYKNKLCSLLPGRREMRASKTIPLKNFKILVVSCKTIVHKTVLKWLLRYNYDMHIFFAMPKSQNIGQPKSFHLFDKKLEMPMGGAFADWKENEQLEWIFFLNDFFYLNEFFFEWFFFIWMTLSQNDWVFGSFAVA